MNNELGIYLIRNTQNGRIYIGSTSKSFDKRWYEHKRLLRSGKHPNIHLQSAWNLYLEKSFSFEIVEICKRKDDILERKQYWIEYYRNEGDIYNIALYASAPMKGREFPEESKTSAKEYPSLTNKITKEILPAGKNVNSLSKRIGVNQSGLWNLFCGKIVSCKGWIVSNGERKNKNTIEYPDFININDGEVIPHGVNLSNVCAEHNLDVRKMLDVIREKRYSYRGWKLLSSDRENRQFCGKSHPEFVNKNTGEVIQSGKNLSKVCKERGLDISTMLKVSKGAIKSHKGWSL